MPQSTVPLMHQGYEHGSTSNPAPRPGFQQFNLPMPQPTIPLMHQGRSVYEHGSTANPAPRPGFDHIAALPQGFGLLSTPHGVASILPATANIDLGTPNSDVGNPYVSSNIWTVNPTNFVTTKLSKVEDFLSWRTQIAGLLIVHKVQGFVDSTVIPPPTHMHDDHGQLVPNPAYTLFLRYDQCIRM